MRFLYTQIQCNISLITGWSKSYCGFLLVPDFRSGCLKRFKNVYSCRDQQDGKRQPVSARFDLRALPSEILLQSSCYATISTFRLARTFRLWSRAATSKQFPNDNSWQQLWIMQTHYVSCEYMASSGRKSCTTLASHTGNWIHLLHSRTKFLSWGTSRSHFYVIFPCSTKPFRHRVTSPPTWILTTRLVSQNTFRRTPFSNTHNENLPVTFWHRSFTFKF